MLITLINRKLSTFILAAYILFIPLYGIIAMVLF